jgi:hypothetical protein
MIDLSCHNTPTANQPKLPAKEKAKSNGAKSSADRSIKEIIIKMVLIHLIYHDKSF